MTDPYSLYYAVHVKPFQAYEYLSAASLKMQNIVKRYSTLTIYYILDANNQNFL